MPVPAPCPARRRAQRAHAGRRRGPHLVPQPPRLPARRRAGGRGRAGPRVRGPPHARDPSGPRAGAGGRRSAPAVSADTPVDTLPRPHPVTARLWSRDTRRARPFVAEAATREASVEPRASRRIVPGPPGRGRTARRRRRSHRRDLARCELAWWRDQGVDGDRVRHADAPRPARVRADGFVVRWHPLPAPEAPLERPRDLVASARGAARGRPGRSARARGPAGEWVAAVDAALRLDACASRPARRRRSRTPTADGLPVGPSHAIARRRTGAGVTV